MKGSPRALFLSFSLLSLALLFFVVAIHLKFLALPLLFAALGFVSYAWNGRRALLLFLFLLPLVNSTPDLFFNGYPFNYMGMPLFHLGGMLCASLLKRERLETGFPGRGVYLFFLALLWVSAVFVFLRWSNLGTASLAFLRDTPVAPSQERVSFAIIFPVITLALFSLSPWAAFLLRHLRLGVKQVFIPLKAGFFLSFLLALVQKWIDPDLLAQSWWGMRMKQLNGGFSDFNAFGFFAGAMFLWQALELMKRLRPKRMKPDEKGSDPELRRPLWPGIAGDLLFLAVALASVMLSGCRTAIFFILAGTAVILHSRKAGFCIKGLIILALIALLVFGGGTLGKRLQRTVSQVAKIPAQSDLFLAVDGVGNTRLSMLRDGFRMIGRFPLSGVGTGNFLFCLKYLRFGKNAYFDLPLNQYLLFFTEGGIIGGLAFLLFLSVLLRRLKPGQERLILVAMALALFFNNFFWFPEVLLLFWVVVSRGDWQPGPEQKSGFAWAAALLLFFTVANGFAFHRLHPRTWARETSTPFDYGFSYPEQKGSRSFRWSGAESGMYLFPAKKRPVPEILFTCGAPLSLLPGRQQAVDFYWRGKLLQRVVFRENATVPIRIENGEDPEGFLEFRVHPTFNLSELGLGPETRDLGVQVEDGA